MQKSLKITFLEESQVDQTVKILCRAFNVAASRVDKDIARSLSDDPYRPIIFVASINDQVVGVVRCESYPLRVPSYHSLFSLAVDPAFRQQGIGHALMRHVEDYLNKGLMPGQQGIISLVDETKKENLASTFYEKMGYAPEQQPRTDEAGFPILRKRINAGSGAKQNPSAPRNN